MRRTIVALTLSALCVGRAAFAEDKYYIDESNSNNNTSQTTSQEATHGYLKNEAVGIKPEAGILAFTQNPVSDSRLAAGIGLDYNATRLLTLDPTLYLGPSTGFIYSRVGGSTFVGSQGGGTDVFLIPANLKAGMNIGNNFRASLHGGGNVMYFGAGAISPDSKWTVYPNAGGDVEIGLGASSVSILLRPDWTFASGQTIFTGLVGIGILMG